MKWIVVVVLLGAALMRLAGASRAPLELIERDEFIPGAMAISSEHLPIRAAQHGALPIYLIRSSGLIFGNSILGLRALSVLAGTGTILLVYLIAARWWGTLAGLVAAGSLAVERYHVAISGRAIDLPFDLFFVALGMFAFSRFLHSLDHAAKPAHRWLYGTGMACALGFLCKELTALMLPVLFLSFIFLGQTVWLRRREPWIAVGLFVVIISPDVYSSLTITSAQRIELRDRHLQVGRQLGAKLTQTEYVRTGMYMSYGDQLSRFRSPGFNREPFYFYFGDILDALGIPHRNGFDEFPFMNPLLGVTLWLGVAFSLMRRNKDKLAVFSLTMFFVAFVPFILVRLGEPRAKFPSDPEVLWYWVDRTMLPALLLSGHALCVLVTHGLVRRRGEGSR